MQANAALTTANEAATKDLGPLAWVLEELRKSLDGASRALRRFVRDAEVARGSDLAALDASQLRIARQQLHQATGALEMVGMTAPARVLRAMEALAQRFVQRPELCSDEAANKMERASFALTEYLEGVLKGRNASCVALFPQYRDVLELVGEERVHPADLWSHEWRWIDVVLATELPALASDATTRDRADAFILKVVQSGDVLAARAMRDISLGFAAAQDALEVRVFWKISAAYFEAVSLGLCPTDIYGKWAASRILLQERSLARGDTEISERLVHDLLFFCAQAVPQSGADAAVLLAVRADYGLNQTAPFDYETRQFGRFDPAQLVQARKRISAATETWSALAGGDTNRLKLALDQFAMVTESVMKLHPENGELVRTLTQAIETTARSGEAPVPSLAMEVATAVLYLEAAYEDLDPTDSHMAERGDSLALRLEHVMAGGQPQPLEKWMEDLYRRVSDRQIMGSVVGELRTALGQVEKSLDLFFRNPLDKVSLHEVPSQLAQMRGVFSVLGLDQAALASLRMRANVENFLLDDFDAETERTGSFLKLGNSLGAIGFLIDMLSYQRELAKKLFVYDEELGEFKPVMGSVKAVARPLADTLVETTEAPLLTLAPETEVEDAGIDRATSDELTEDDELELKDIFLDEAREVIADGLLTVKELTAEPADLAQQTMLRRVFHMLKGSSRMVGLDEFGEAAWAVEQLLNTWLADQKPASSELLSLADKALQGFARWVEDIAVGADAAWHAQAFRLAADGMRLDNQVVDLLLPGEVAPVSVATSEPEADFAVTRIFEPAETPQAESAEVEAVTPEIFDFAKVDELPQTTVTQTDVVPQEQTPVAQVVDDVTVLQVSAAQIEQASLERTELDDQIKVIGTLRIGIPLYNVYLNEADEWSRRLFTELAEWALELHRPVFDSTVGLAHSLGGSSATVGFIALSNMARALEQALRHVQLHRSGMPEHVQVFIQAAEDIRRLLHQFAAGFLKEPDEAVLAALRAISETEFAALPADVADSLYAEQPPESEIPDESGFEPHSGVQLVEAETEVQAPDTELSDALDVDLFPVFEEETLELLPQLGGALRQWAARPDNLGARNEALRVLHTLKGSARLAGAMRLGEMSHRLESAIEQLGAKIFQPQELELLLTRFDQIQANFEQLRITPQAALSLPETSQLPEEPELQTQPGPAEQPAIGVVAPVVTPSLPATVVSAFTPLAPLRQLTSQTVRVRSQLLDRMVNQAGEVMITRSRLEARLVQLRASLGELTGNLDRLRSQLRDIELQSESQMQSRLAQVKDSAQAFDPLEFDRFTRVQELTRMMAESVHDVATVQRNLQRTAEGTEDDLIAQGRQARELQRDLLRTRMVEFEGISERLFGVVRQAAKDSGKQVRLEIKGGSLDMDRGVLERMAPVFEHLLRNAVAHGIEDPQARVAAAKPVVGAISIHLYQQSNDVTVEFSDDGAGLNLAQIRKQAVADGSVSADELLTDAQATQLIFKPGFSTAAEVTELAGRGIGLDVVRAEVNALGGRVETTTEHGQGTKFKLVLPLTTAVTQVVMLRIGEMSIGVPANLVEMVRRVPAADLARAYQDNVYEFNGESVPFFWAGALLQASAHNREPNTKSSAVAVFRSAGQRLAMHVSEVLGNQEVVVKNLGPQLSRLPGLVGMSVLASGAVVLIYNPVALTSVYGQMARQLSSQTEQDRRSSPVLLDSISQTPMVLVVDDSITVRRVTQRLLKREGFRVVLAADGLQALEKLREEKPVVVLSDIEMPRMDGFDLARTIRADAKLCDIPIIMITSRIAEKHRDHARELGVDHYLGKPYSEDELIGLVRQYCAVPAETTP